LKCRDALRDKADPACDWMAASAKDLSLVHGSVPPLTLQLHTGTMFTWPVTSTPESPEVRRTPSSPVRYSYQPHPLSSLRFASGSLACLPGCRQGRAVGLFVLSIIIQWNPAHWATEPEVRVARLARCQKKTSGNLTPPGR
jgi:hypothetical protein